MWFKSIITPLAEWKDNNSGINVLLCRDRALQGDTAPVWQDTATITIVLSVPYTWCHYSHTEGKSAWPLLQTHNIESKYTTILPWYSSIYVFF